NRVSPALAFPNWSLGTREYDAAFRSGSLIPLVPKLRLGTPFGGNSVARGRGALLAGPGTCPREEDRAAPKQSFARSGVPKLEFGNEGKTCPANRSACRRCERPGWTLASDPQFMAYCGTRS